jgi:hypothetical protein
MIPPAKPDDSEDVSWALSTAQTSFGRGDLHEALKWLRRAAESASEADQDDRALEIAKAVAELSAKAGASRPPPPPASRPPASARPPPVPPPIPSSPASAPRPASVAPRPLAVPSTKQGPRPPSVAPKAPAPVRVTPPQAAPAEKKARRKSIPDEATDRVDLPPKHEEPSPPTPRAAAVSVEQKKARRRSRDDLTRASNADELEAMPTQTMEAHELPEFEENGSTKVGTPAGVVRISIAATENSVPVMVVPIEPGTDLSKLLG